MSSNAVPKRGGGTGRGGGGRGRGRGGGRRSGRGRGGRRSNERNSNGSGNVPYEAKSTQDDNGGSHDVAMPDLRDEVSLMLQSYFSIDNVVCWIFRSLTHT